MQQRRIPKQLQFNFVRPKGFSSEFTQWVINPMGQQATFSPDEILRYQMNLNTGHFDPYRSYFQIIVQTDIPCGAMQIDSSAFSFINQSLITGIMTASQLQRIPQYDQIGAMTVQLGFQPIFSTGKQYMGLGRSFFTGCAKSPVSAVSSANSSLMQSYDGNDKMQYFTDYGTNTFNPVFINRQQTTIGAQNLTSSGAFSGNLGLRSSKGFSKYQQITDLGQFSGDYPLNSTNILGNVPSFVSQLNRALYQGKFSNNNIPRVQYSLSTLDTKYIDASHSRVRNNVTVSPTTNFIPTQPLKKYSCQPTQNLRIKYYDLESKATTTPAKDFYVQNTCGLHGYLNPYSPQLSIGLQEPFLSPTIPQCGMKNGRVTKSWLPVQQKRFVVPFLSSIMGALIPQQSYSLLPVQAFKVYIQLTLNKFAMFSSGYNDRSPIDYVGMQYPIQRRFYFRRFNYVLQLYYFQQPQLKNYLARSLQQGFIFSTQQLMLTSNYVIPNQLALRGSWTVNTPQTYLTQLIIRFIDTRYLRYPFLRKQYALSCNITSFQIKFDTKWFPPQPIIGNAGNPQYLDNTGNVQPYIQMLLRTKDSLFTRTPQGITNNINFAINSRIFVPELVTPMMDPNITIQQQQKQCTINKSSQINTSTAMGFPFFHENRICGRALYVFNFQTLGHSKGLANGLVVGNSRPFQVLLNTSVQQAFEGQIAMYIFTRSHSLVQVSKRGVRINDY